MGDEPRLRLRRGFYGCDSGCEGMELVDTDGDRIAWSFDCVDKDEVDAVRADPAAWVRAADWMRDGPPADLTGLVLDEEWSW